MTKFTVAYSSFLIGFMVMFMIIFSEQDAFNINFLGVFGKVIHLSKIWLGINFNIFPQGVGHDDWRI